MEKGQVRRAVATDLPALLVLYRQMRPEEQPPSHAAAAAALADILNSSSSCILVVETTDGVVASCGLAIIPTLGHGAQPFAVVENVVTHSDYRRRGHGRAVLMAACEMARAAGCYKLCLSSGSRQEATLRFYEGAGFARNSKNFFEIRWDS